MRELFSHVKLALGAILAILLVSLAVLGGYRVYKDHFIIRDNTIYSNNRWNASNTLLVLIKS